MKENYKRVFCEFALTFLLLLFATALLGETLSGYRKYLVFGLPAGFIFSWLARGKKSAINLIIISALLAAFFGIAYSLFNSTFIYKRVVTILLEGALILEIILSFDAYLTPLLTYIQAISIPLFMACSIFIRDYDQFTVILILGYFTVWAAILNIKFHGLFQPIDKKSKSGYYSASLFIIFFMAILFISWVLFPHFSFGKIKKGGIFLEAGDAEEDADSLEVEYYGLQDKIQDKINRLIPEFKSHNQQYEMLALMSSLVKESPDTMEVDKAAQGLIDPWRRPGPGLEEKDSGELTILINDYLNKKTSINTRRAQEEIIDTLKKNRLNIKDRITSSFHLNRMRQGGSFQQINKEEQGLSKVFDDAPFDSKTKRKLKDSLNQFKEWKAFEIYQEKINVINEMINSPADSLKGEFQKMLSGIRAAGSLEDIRKVAKYIEEIQGMAQPDDAEVIKNIKEILRIKSDMLVSLKAKELKTKIEKSGLSQYGLDKLADTLDAVKDAEDSRMLLEHAVRLKEKAGESGLDIIKEINNFLETKIYISTKTKKNKIEDRLKENIPDDLKKKFLEEVEKMLQEKNSDKIVSGMQKMENDIEKFFNQGLISEASKNNLTKEFDGLEELLIFKLKIYAETSKGDILKYDKQLTYQEVTEEFIDNSSLDGGKKQVFKELAERLSGAKTLSESENIKDEIETEIGFLSKEGIKQEEIKSYVYELSNNLAGEKRTFWYIKIMPKYLHIPLGGEGEFTAKGVYSDNSEDELTKIAGWISSNNEIITVTKGKVSTASVGKADLYAEFRGLKSLPATVVVEGPKLISIALSPQGLKLSMRDRLRLKAEGYFSDSSHKDITSLVSWNILGPRAIRVEEGNIRPVRFGQTKVYAEYAGISSLPVDISIILTVDWLLRVIFNGVLALILVISMIFSILYMLTVKEKKKLLALYGKPNEFIVALYENLRQILNFFDLGYEESIAPLAYAELIEKKLSVERRMFLRLSSKFEEAKYSRHILQSADASLILNDYNNFLKILLSKYKKFYLFFRHCLILLHKRPVFLFK